MIGPAVVELAKRVLDKAKISPEANESLLVLIIKEEKPLSIKVFKPIILCNVSIKLATKVIVNRLKSIWISILSPKQSSFIARW